MVVNRLDLEAEVVVISCLLGGNGKLGSDMCA